MHGLIDLLTGVETHAAAARDQVSAARLQTLPNVPQHRGHVHRHPHMLEPPLEGMRLECVWRDFPGPYHSSHRTIASTDRSGVILVERDSRFMELLLCSRMRNTLGSAQTADL